MGSELKFLDTTKAATLIATTGTVLDNTLLVIPQDSTESGRIGHKVTIKTLSIHAQMIMATTTNATTTDGYARFIVYLDKQCNGTTAGITDILETASVNSFNNLANKSRFHILYDKKLSMQTQGATTSGAAFTYPELRKPFDKYFKVNLPIEYDNSATTGAIATIRSNNIGVLAISEGAQMQVAYTARIRYTDN